MVWVSPTLWLWALHTIFYQLSFTPWCGPSFSLPTQSGFSSDKGVAGRRSCVRCLPVILQGSDPALRRPPVNCTLQAFLWHYSQSWLRGVGLLELQAGDSDSPQHLFSVRNEVFYNVPKYQGTLRTPEMRCLRLLSLPTIPWLLTLVGHALTPATETLGLPRLQRDQPQQLWTLSKPNFFPARG